MFKNIKKAGYVFVVACLFTFVLPLPNAIAQKDGLPNGKPFQELSEQIAVNSESITELNAQTSLIISDISELQDDISGLQDDMTALAERVTANEGNIEQLRSELDDLVQRFETAQTILEVQLFVIRDQIGILNDVLVIHGTTLEQVSFNLIMILALQTDVLSLQNTLTSLSVQLTTLRLEFDNHESDNHENLAGYQRISNSETIDDRTVGDSLATCPEGKVVVGGGWSGGTMFALINNQPLGDRTWIVSADNRSDASHTLTAYAICASRD